MNLHLKEAQSIVDLARSHAEKIGVPMNIAVVDGGGHLIAFARMDKSILGSIDIALRRRRRRSAPRFNPRWTASNARSR